MYHIISDPVLLGLCRLEIDQLAQDPGGADGAGAAAAQDLARIRTACPVLVSTWHEVERFHSDPTLTRAVARDYLLDGRYLLKQGARVIVLAGVIHRDVALWGPTAHEFDHRRFLGAGPKSPGVALTFGAGSTMCPGRHFVSVEILQMAAMLICRLDLKPTAGHWSMPCKVLMLNTAFPTPYPDVEVEVVAREGHARQFVFMRNSSAQSLDV